MAAKDWTTTFPILGTKTYLASHSLGAVPASTADALARYYEEWATLGIQAWDGPWWASVTGFASDIEKLLGARKATVVPFQNATRAMAAVTSALDFTGPRRKVVMTDLEFTTFYPFWRGQERNGAEIVLVESEDRITVPPEKIAKAIDEKTLLVATCHAYFRSGAVQDLKALSKAAHAKGALILGDGYQATGTLPVDVRALDVDFYVGGCHKYLLGGPGAGYLYVRPELVPDLKPTLTGWFGLDNPFGYVKDLEAANANEGVFKFLDGTPNVPPLYAAREGLKEIFKEGMDAIRRRSLARTSKIMDRADALGLQVKTPRSEARSGMVCLDFDGAKEATRRIIQNDVIVDWRPECGMRMSPHFYNSDADVERFFDELATARAGKRRTVPRLA